MNAELLLSRVNRLASRLYLRLIEYWRFRNRVFKAFTVFLESMWLLFSSLLLIFLLLLLVLFLIDIVDFIALGVILFNFIFTQWRFFYSKCLGNSIVLLILIIIVLWTQGILVNRLLCLSFERLIRESLNSIFGFQHFQLISHLFT
jgi:hypothetical protein